MAYERILLGMGNPLLDISAVVDDDFLHRYFPIVSRFFYCPFLWYKTQIAMLFFIASNYAYALLSFDFVGFSDQDINAWAEVL